MTTSPTGATPVASTPAATPDPQATPTAGQQPPLPDVEVLNNEAAGQQQPTPVKQDTHPQQQPTSEMTLRRSLSSSVQAGTPAGTPVEFKSSNSGEVQPAGRAPGVAAVLECWDRAHPCARVLAGRTVPDPV